MANILFVDDEPHILSALKRTFRNHEGWTCSFANGPLEALEILAQHQITVLVSDHKMPQMTGAEFLARVKEKRPNMIRIMLTGQADLEAVKKAVNEGAIYRFILKPWDDRELTAAIENAVEYFELTHENERLTQLTTAQNEQLKELNSHLEEQVETRTGQLKDALFTAQALNVRLQESFHGMAKAFFSFVEVALPEVGSHARRVAEHCVKVAPRLGLTDRETADLEIAALLHDVGKIGFPAFMLEKNVKDYSSDEFNIYRSHPLGATERLKNIYGFETICTYVQAHHERYDGSGFPMELKGNSVPFQAYIIGIVDEYDHLINRRQDNMQFNYQYTKQKLAEFSGETFPARLVTPFLAYIEEINCQQTDVDETRVWLAGLIPHMCLSRDIYTMSGTLLLTRGAVLTTQSIHRIRSISKVDPIAGDIYVVKELKKVALSN